MVRNRTALPAPLLSLGSASRTTASQVNPPRADWFREISMARSQAAWGIDIGQCALKAMLCRVSPDDPDKLIAEAFDYIEYPKILTQPDAEPEELVKDAIEQFLSRNSVK